MPKHVILTAILAVFFLAGYPAHAQYSPSDTLKAVAPGLVYKEFQLDNPITGDQWRVTDPDASFTGDPTNEPAAFLPNPVLSLSIDDLQGAIKAVAVIDVFGGHVGTVGKQFRLNENAWIDVPFITGTPTDPQCYTQQYSIEVEVPLADLVAGTNDLQGTSDGQTCYGFGWGQWGWYGIMIRVIYDPAQKSAPAGSVTSPATGATIGDNALFAVDVSGSPGVDRVEYVGRYEDYDFDGDGIYTDWQQSYHRLRGDGEMILRNHIGTSIVPPFDVTWDNTWVPEQPAGGIDVVARIRDASGLWYVTDRVTGLTLDRPGTEVRLYQAENVPERFWVRAGWTKTSNFTIPAEHDLAIAASARLSLATWNGVSGEAEFGEDHWTRVNGWETPEYGEDHYYSFDRVEIPVGILQTGSNSVTFRSQSSHHGAEILWPGPSMVVRYVDYSLVPATVITGPSDTYVLEDSLVTFSVTAVGAEPISYQWQRNGVDIPGADAPTYTTPAVTVGDDGDVFRCAVSNGLGGEISGDAVLHVLVPGPRIDTGQIVLYDFDEGGGNTVHDVSGVGAPLDLTVGDPGAVSWLPGALSLDTATLVSSAGAATKVNDAVMASNEITVEAWLKPANLTQNGPARIVTVSAGSTDRNFTLGQGVWNSASDVVEVRVRATSTDLNGKPALASPGADLGLDLTHVVFTRDTDGTTRIYFDGAERISGTTSGPFSNWDPSYGLGLGDEMGGGRPWLGELHLVAMFDRALQPEEVLQNFVTGPGEPVEPSEINVTASLLHDLGGPVSLRVLPDGQGDALAAARSWSGIVGESPAVVDATILVRLVDGAGDPVVGFPAEKITVVSQSGGWGTCPAEPLTADAPTDINGETTLSGALHAGGFSAPGELLLVSVDDPLVNDISYPDGAAGLEIFVNGPDMSGDLRVNLEDIPAFTVIFFGGVYDFAADFFHDGIVNLSDVGKLGEAVGSECLVAGGKSAALQVADGSLGMVFDLAGSSSAATARPGEPVDAYIVLHGAAARAGVEAFDFRIRTSDNVIIHGREILGDGIRFTTGDDFVVGYGERRQGSGDRPLPVVHLVVSVTNGDPAHFWLESRGGRGGNGPALVRGGEILTVRPASGAVVSPVAALNDASFALENGNLPAPELAMRIAPNPFNPRTEIRFSLPERGAVTLRIYDARGQLVSSLVHGEMAAGDHDVMWTGTDGRGRHVASGVYFSKLETEAGVLLEKMMLLR